MMTEGVIVMVKICKECGGIVNYDPYFNANVCSCCGIMERIFKNKLKTINTVYSRSKFVKIKFSVKMKG